MSHRSPLSPKNPKNANDTPAMHKDPLKNGTVQMRVVKIQDLPPVKKDSSSGLTRSPPVDMAEYWKYKKSTKGNGSVSSYRASRVDKNSETSAIVKAYIENCSADKETYLGNGFFAAFVEAYNNHEDVILSPDDVWLIICLQFSKYVNKHAEELRDVFVSHKGQKKLKVTTWNQRSESEWEEFFELIKPAIDANTKGNIVKVLQNDFSTTSLVEQMVSTACIMTTFKKYFSYGRCIPMCGIRNVCFMGTRQDWTNLLSKLEKLKSFGKHKKWTDYVKAVRDILTRFIEAYDGKDVDVDWWNKVFHREYRRVGSGGSQVAYTDGWVLNFFGIYGKYYGDDLNHKISGSIDVPVNIDNRYTNIIKQVHMVGGFGCALHMMPLDGRTAYRPHTSMIVYHDPKNQIFRL